MTLLAWPFGKQSAIRWFLRVLPRKLEQDYGHRGPFTPEQIEATLRRNKPSRLAYAPYALAIFCDPAKLREVRRDLRRLRAEIGETYFSGDAEFSLREVHERHADASGHAGPAESAAHGHHGHGGGGHSL